MIKRIVVPTCPICHAPIDQSVKADQEVYKSKFVGTDGDRETVCHEGAHWHIRAGSKSRYIYLIHKAKQGVKS